MKQLRTLLQVKASGIRRFEHFVNTAIYPPLLYLPQAVGIDFGRFLGLPVLAWLYLARIANAGTWVACAYIAIRCNERTARTLFVFALIPMVVQQANSVSADALLFGLSIVFAALLARLADDGPSRMAGLPLLALGLTTITFGAGKIGYILLALMPLAVAFLKERRIGPKALFLTLCSLAALAIWAGWAWAIHNSVFLYRSGERIDPTAQMAYTIANPVTVATLVSREAVSAFPAALLQMVGRKLGWMTIALPIPACIAALALLLSNIAIGDRIITPARWPFRLAVIVSVVSIVTIYFLLFLQYNKVGATTIIGFQGRYLIPLAMVCATLAHGFIRRPRLTAAIEVANIVGMSAIGVWTLIVVAQASWVL